MRSFDRIAATFADVDELLDQADAQTIDECLARGEAPDHRDDDKPCDWCGHQFHGLGCYSPVMYLIVSTDFDFTEDPIDDAALPLTAAGDWPCRCNSALDPLDDTWRPIILPTATTNLMRATGLDGWAARALFDRALVVLQSAMRDTYAKWQPSAWAEAPGPDGEPVTARLTPNGIIVARGDFTVATIGTFEPGATVPVVTP